MQKQKKISSALLLLLLGGATTYLGGRMIPSASADTITDAGFASQFKIVFIIGVVMVLISFVLLALATMSTEKK